MDTRAWPESFLGISRESQTTKITQLFSVQTLRTEWTRLLWPSHLSPNNTASWKVDALVALRDRLEVALATRDTTRQHLLEALLHEALVPAATRVTEAAE